MPITPTQRISLKKGRGKSLRMQNGLSNELKGTCAT